ncbi:MAG: hypothetical protein ACMUHM_08700 [Thermoplasmatota archaeon]
MKFGQYLCSTSPSLLLLVVIAILITSGCLSGDDTGGDDVISAFSKAQRVYDIADSMEGDLELVVVTGMEPGDDGRAGFWKFAYNNVTSGTALASVKFTVNFEGWIEVETGEPLSKTPIRNWTIDSTSAYSYARDRLIADGVITDRVKITVTFIYLLGEKIGNNGCDWTIGMVLGSEEPLEVTARVDGHTGDIINFQSAKS